MSKLTGRGSGSGKYSFQSRSLGNQTCYVSHMPEDIYKMRIAFTHNGQTEIPIMILDMTKAKMLWGALNAMAKDLNFEDYGSEK